MTRAIVLGALLLMAHLLAGFRGEAGGRAAPPTPAGTRATSAPPPPPSVTVARPLQKNITEWDEYTGRFAAVETVEVRARVSGFIDSINFKEGQIVKQGDPLFVIDQRPYKLAVDQAKADLERARAKLEIASLDVQRGTPLARTQAL